MDDSELDGAPAPTEGDDVARVALMRSDLRDLEDDERRSLWATGLISAASVPLMVMLVKLVMLDSPWRIMFLASIFLWIGLIGFGWYRFLDVRAKRLRHARELDRLEAGAPGEGLP